MILTLDTLRSEKYFFRPFTVGGRSSMVERQFVVLVVAGSSPVGHPIPLFFCFVPLLSFPT